MADPVERPVTIYHVLKLFQVSKKVNAPIVFVEINQITFLKQTGTGPSTDPSALKGGKSVVSEFYDEIIFQDPTQYIQVKKSDQLFGIVSIFPIQPLLTTTRQLTMGAHKHETDFEVNLSRFSFPAKSE